MSAYRVPTEQPESDGTLEWSSTGVVVVEVLAGGERGLGWTYNHPAAAAMIAEDLAERVRRRPANDIKGCWDEMRGALRNAGVRGLAASAISAVDIALWDLKARLLGLPLALLLGRARDSIAAYGSGGFTSYDLDHLQRQLGGWVEEGFTMVKMKIGRRPERDPVRVHAAREAIGSRPQLFADANGAYSRRQALDLAETFAASGVTWYEEPVSSDDLPGLRLVRDRAPAKMRVAAGEYGWEPSYFRRMLDAGAVDVLQADATRCLGITGFLLVAALCEARSMPLSAHCAPSVHLHPCCAATPAVHLEYFHDHVRIERMLFEGAVLPHRGRLAPDLSRPGHGMRLSPAEARRFAV